MIENVRELVKKEKPHLIKYKKYISEKNWNNLTFNGIGKPKSNIEVRKEEFDLHNTMVATIISRLKVVAKKSEGYHHYQVFKEYVNEIRELIELHTERAEKYTLSTDLTSIESTALGSEEISFHRHLHQITSKTNEDFINLNLKTEEDPTAEGLQWFNEQKVTVAMLETLMGQYPEIKNKLEKLGIDFNSPPPPTIHILNENPPEYNPDINIYDQPKEVIQYYVDEYKKIERGVEIDGYFIDGWLYFHFNFFTTSIPTTIEINGIKENKDIIKIPELRDNEILITDYFVKSKKEGRMSLIAASRRIAKTTLNSSRITRAQVLNKRQILCAGGSADDLNHIHNNLDIYHNNCHPAFKLYYLSATQDGRGKSYGIKTKANKSKVTNNVFILNLEGGTKKGKQESLAGFSPDEFIYDEIYKQMFKKNLLALEPALWGSGVLRCSVIMTGTGGNDELAKDGISMLNNPIANKVCLMDWESLEKNIDPEDITWRRKNFGLFLPTQMSIKHLKIKSNLADYLGINSETLSKVPLWVTNWKQAKKDELIERQNKSDNREDYIRLLAYHPFDPEEIFLSGKVSPFVDIVDDAKRHRDFLIESGKWDKRFNLFRDSNGKIQTQVSKEDLVPFPFSGGMMDAPYLIIEHPDIEKAPKYYYVCGGDFAKYETSDTTDSVSTIYVFKFPLVGDKTGGKLVASWSGRPKSYKILCERMFILQEFYNAIMLPEDVDLGVYQTYLENKKLEEEYLEKHIDFKGALTYSTVTAKKYGWTPQQSKHKLITIFRKYLEEEVLILDDYDKEVTVKRVQTIDDIHLLSEIIAFSENGNFDRLISAMAATGLLHFLDNNYMYPKVGYKRPESQEENSQSKPQRKINHFLNNTHRKSFLRRR